MTEEQIDYQLGASDVDQSPIGDGEFVPFQMESRVVFRRLAEDIYPSPKVGIREAITNAITATKKVNDENFEPIINISVNNEERNRPCLIIEDNGIGMTMQTIRDVVSYIGRSTVRDDNQKSGQFGMGFLALFSLCGSNGGFIMHTNSRKNNSEPISGVWKDGGFSRFETNSPESQNMIGTKFEIMLREEISVKDVRKWVKNTAKWSRVPILYEDKTYDGVYSNEFGVSKIDSLVTKDSPSITIDNKYYKVICSTNLKETPTILLDVLIDRGDVDVPYIPFDNIAIRLKTEHPVSMKGPYEGKMVIRDIEYERLPDERKSLYVPERKIKDETPITPSPTGTREKLNENSNFWNHVGKEIKKEYDKKSKKIVKSIDKNHFSNIDISAYKFLEDYLFTKLKKYNLFDSFIKSKFENLYSEELSQKIYALMQTVEVHNYDYNTNTTQSTDEKVYEIINENYSYVFMFINRINNKKARLIHASGENYVFVQIKNSNWYNFYENTFSWNKLKDVHENHSICANVDSKDIQELSESNTRNNTEEINKKNDTEEIVTIYVGDERKSINLDELPKKFKTKDNNYILDIAGKDIEKLIIFSQNSEYDISDYKWLRCDKYALVNARTNDIKKELENMPASIEIDKFIGDSKQIKLQTSKGVKSCKNIAFEESIIHVMQDNLYADISDEEMCIKMNKLCSESIFSCINTPSKNYYIPITKSKLYDILPFMKKAIIINTQISKLPIQEYNKGPNSAQCKLYLSKFEDRNTDIIQELDKRIFHNQSLSGARISILSLLKQIGDSEDIDLQEVSNNE